MKDKMLAALRDAKSRNEVVSLHSNSLDQTACSVGFVDQVSDAEVRLESIDRFGQMSGYEVRSLKDVFRVDINGHYERKMSFLAKHQRDIWKQVKLEPLRSEDNLMLATLRQALHEDLIVILWGEDKKDSVVGYVKDLDDQEIEINSIDDYGRDDGLVVLRLDTIADMDCNTSECQVAKFLNLNWGGKLGDVGEIVTFRENPGGTPRNQGTNS